jgi:APA family basic amino acid/polyamine antiporter
MFAACFSHGMAVVAYLVIFGVVMLGGVFFSREREF